MSDDLQIVAEWEHLDRGSPEERACFAAIGIVAEGLWLTEAGDAFVHRVRSKVHLSGYRLAEWFAWNYWRQRWESAAPHRSEWPLAHRMSTIGGGYVWPNLTIQSDGERVALVARATLRRAAEPLRYLCDAVVAVPASSFEAAVAAFVEQVRGQLRAEGVPPTNLDRIWEDVRTEKGEPALARRRRLEALLGFEPDEGPETTLEQIEEDAAISGEHAIEELAAATSSADAPPRLADLLSTAAAEGADARPGDAVRLQDAPVRRSPTEPAWQLGASAASALREQEGLGDVPVSDARLAALAGVESQVLERKTGAPFSFAWDEPGGRSRVVLRSTPFGANRRFDLARLLGDRLASVNGDRLFPATRAFTYRQKWQRAFAAELLCPFRALEHELAGDHSDEAITGAAAKFGVGELAVRYILVSHGLLAREDAAAAVAVV